MRPVLLAVFLDALLIFLALVVIQRKQIFAMPVLLALFFGVYFLDNLSITLTNHIPGLQFVPNQVWEGFLVYSWSGKLYSIFLAKEYGVRVWAADLWIKPTENFARIRQAGVEGLVYPIHTDARSLPFAEAYFDVVICTDAYIYFGTDDLYLEYLLRFLKPGGQVGISIPGFMRELEGQLPEHILPFWAQECWTWRTIDWWRWHWGRTGLVDVKCVDKLPEGSALWLQWKEALKAAGDASPDLDSDIQVLEADRGRFMGFIRMVAQRK